MLKNNKGVTLIALVVTIIVLLIIVSVGAYSGIATIEGSKAITFSMELKMLQEQVELLNIKAKKDNSIYNLGTSIASITDTDLKNQLESILNELGITDYDGYRYFTQKQILDLGLEGVEQDVVLNIAKKEVISITGFNKSGTIYRTLKQMADANLIENTYDVSTNTNVQENEISFDVTYSSIGNNMFNIEINNISSTGFVKKVKISYSYNSNNFEKVAENYTDDSYTFEVENEGSYILKVEDAAGNYMIKELIITK